MSADEILHVVIRCSTINEFDENYTVWLLNPDDPEDEIDVIFEAEDLRQCLFFCERAGYEVEDYPGMQMSAMTKKKLKKATCDDILEVVDTEVIVDLVMELTGDFLDRQRLRQRITREKQLIEMRKDPGHEAWMEQR